MTLPSYLNRAPTREESKACAEWLAWVEAGAGEHDEFWLGDGLGDGLCGAIHAVVKRYPRGLFTSAYPFGGYNKFNREGKANTLHLNPQRLAAAKVIAEWNHE